MTPVSACLLPPPHVTNGPSVCAPSCRCGCEPTSVKWRNGVAGERRAGRRRSVRVTASLLPGRGAALAFPRLVFALPPFIPDLLQPNPRSPVFQRLSPPPPLLILLSSLAVRCSFALHFSPSLFPLSFAHSPSLSLPPISTTLFLQKMWVFLHE